MSNITITPRRLSRADFDRLSAEAGIDSSDANYAQWCAVALRVGDDAFDFTALARAMASIGMSVHHAGVQMEKAASQLAVSMTASTEIFAAALQRLTDRIEP